MQLTQRPFELNFSLMNFDVIRREVWIVAVQSRGPGGQNVNKVASAAQLHWPYLWSEGLSADEKSRIRENLKNKINSQDEIYLRSDESRDLERNKAMCLQKLEALLKAALFRPKPRRATKPTRASKVRRLEGKRQRADIKRGRQKVRD